MTDAYRDNQIDRFVCNEMSPEERAAFCLQLQADKELQKQVKLRGLLAEAVTQEMEKEAFRAMKAGYSKDMRRECKECEEIRKECKGCKELTDGQKARSKRHLIIMRNCAAVAAVLLGLLFFIGNSHRYSPQELFRAHYVEPVIGPSRGGNEVASALRDASCCLKQGRTQETIALITPQILESIYGEEAGWLLLCAYLQAGERAKAKETALSIRRENGLYAAEAAAILKQLEEKRWF